jgi:ubiquinol-cytochrome c reductase subunit 8
MGMHFGELGARVRGVITYSLSPMEQRAFAGVISKGIPNMFRRFRGQVFRVAPPFVLAYILYDWAERDNAKLCRKNPKDYENET